jgi:hypothetical protein
MVGLLVLVAADLLEDGKQIITALSPLCASVLAQPPEADITAESPIELPAGMMHVLQRLCLSLGCISKAGTCLPTCLPAWVHIACLLDMNTGATLLSTSGEATLYQTYISNTTAMTPAALLCPSGSWVVGVVGYTDPDDLYLQRM